MAVNIHNFTLITCTNYYEGGNGSAGYVGNAASQCGGGGSSA